MQSQSSSSPGEDSAPVTQTPPRKRRAGTLFRWLIPVVAGVLLSLGILFGIQRRPAPTPAIARGASSSENSTTALPVVPAAELVAELGCGACHTGVPVSVQIRQASPPLDNLGARYSHAQLLAYLQQPRSTRRDIGRARMPDFRFDEQESLALTLYLLGDLPARADVPREARRAFEETRRRHPEVNTERGRAIFASQNCAGCHVRTGQEGWRNAPDLSGEGSRARPEWLYAFLRSPRPVRPFGFHVGTGGRMPDFRLSPEEADSVHALLMRQTVPLPGDERESPYLTPFLHAKAEALVRDRLPCLGCHALGGEGGKIGPDLGGVASRRQPAYVRALLRDPQATVPGTVMPRVPMTKETEDLVVAYLLGSGMAEERDEQLSLVTTPLRAPAGTGEASVLYGRFCAGCHGSTGAGDGFNAAFLPERPTAHASAEAMVKRPDDTLYDGIHAGGVILNRSHRMPGFGHTLDRQQIRSLVRYIRQLCRCEGPEWSRDGIAGGY